MTEPTEDRCPKCNRGREACEWCHDLAPLDYETICDCGLYDFGHHLLDCSTTAEEQWVIQDSDMTPIHRIHMTKDPAENRCMCGATFRSRTQLGRHVQKWNSKPELQHRALDDRKP